MQVKQEAAEMTTSSNIPAQGASEDQLAALAQGDRPVLEAIAAMNLDTLALSSLDPQSYMLVRLAALVAVDAPPASYLANLGMAAEVGLSREDVQGVLTAIAPIVGSPRLVAAAGNTLRALGLAEMAEEARG
jgi:alkylhydroperoxidase/carboxymuconolactone decarboxylase family protein YurZ